MDDRDDEAARRRRHAEHSRSPYDRALAMFRARLAQAERRRLRAGVTMIAIAGIGGVACFVVWLLAGAHDRGAADLVIVVALLLTAILTVRERPCPRASVAGLVALIVALVAWWCRAMWPHLGVGEAAVLVLILALAIAAVDRKGV